MQATLVSHYGEKSDELASYVKRCQSELTTSLSSAFTPYEMPQVHGTIIGLEGCRRNGRIENANFRERRQQIRHMDPSQLLTFLRSPTVPTFDVRIGGYSESFDHGFLSQGKHPYLRSFSIQGSIAVAMGWPVDRTSVFDDFRHSFNQLGVLHKWHKTETDIDNDFFFVLGRVNRDAVTDTTIAVTETNMRQIIAAADPITVNINRSVLRIVSYSDTHLPLATSHAHAIDNATFTPDDLWRCYDSCDDGSIE